MNASEMMINGRAAKRVELGGAVLWEAVGTLTPDGMFLGNAKNAYSSEDEYSQLDCDRFSVVYNNIPYEYTEMVMKVPNDYFVDVAFCHSTILLTEPYNATNSLVPAGFFNQTGWQRDVDITVQLKSRHISVTVRLSRHYDEAKLAEVKAWLKTIKFQ